MGTTKKRTKNKSDRAGGMSRIELLIEDAYEIAANSFAHAKALSESGTATGIQAWMYAAEKAIGEIIRLDTVNNGRGEYQNHYTIEFLEPPPPRADA